jgi:uncharacterized protein (TIGR02246 family)
MILNNLRKERHLVKVLAMLFGTAAIAFAMAACNQAPPPATVVPDTHDADIKAIGDIETQWNSDYAARDADKIVSHYTDDAVLMTPGEEEVKGKDGIRNAVNAMMSDKAFTATFKASKVDVSKSGELGYSLGEYKLTATDPFTHKVANDHGSYVTTYRKQPDGSWKAETDIVTSAVPPAAPKHR